MKYYKGFTGKTADETTAFNVEFERLKLIASEKKADDKFSLKDMSEFKVYGHLFRLVVFFKLLIEIVCRLANRDALKGLSNGIILANFAHLTGIFVFVTYAALVFKQVGASQIDPYTSSIAIAIVQIIGNLCTSRLSGDDH